MAFKTEVEALAEHIANKFINSGQQLNLSKLVAEAALENNYNIEKIKRLIEETNRAVFYLLFNTKQDKNIEFPIAKFDEVSQYLNNVPTAFETGVTNDFADLIDESDFDLKDLALLEGKSQMFEELPQNKMDEIRKEIEDAKERERNKAIRITITYMKAASEELKIAAMQENEFRLKLRELLNQAAKLGLSYNDVDMTLKQTLGSSYTSEIQKIVREEYQKVVGFNGQAVKIAAKKDEIGLTVHELEFLESLRDLTPENMKKILQLSNKVNPERLRNVIANTYGPTSIRTKLIDKILRTSKDVMNKSITDVVKYSIDTESSPELDADATLESNVNHSFDSDRLSDGSHKHASWRMLDWIRAVEAEKELFNGFNDVLRKKAESVSDYLRIKEMLINLASSESEKRMIMNSIDKKAEEIVKETLIKMAGSLDFLSGTTKHIKSLFKQATNSLAGQTQGKTQIPSPVQNLQGIFPDSKQLAEKLSLKQLVNKNTRGNLRPKNPGLDYSYRKKQAEEIAQGGVEEATGTGKGTKFLNKLTQGMNVAAPFLNVATGVLNIAGGIQTLRSIDLDIKAKKKQLEQQYKLGHIIGKAVKNEINKLAASAIIPAAAQVATKTAPVLKKVFNGLKATSNFLDQNSFLVNMGMGLVQNYISNEIAAKQDELNALNKTGATQPDWNLLLNSLNLVRGNSSFFANRPYNLEGLKQAIKEKNPEWEPEVIEKTINTVANYSPTILEDPYLIEEVIRRVRTYGGLDLNYLEQLQKITERNYNIKSNKLTSI